MNNLEKAKQALNKNKLQRIVIIIAGDEKAMKAFNDTGVESVRDSFVKTDGSFQLKKEEIRVDFYYDNPMLGSTSGGPKMPVKVWIGHDNKGLSPGRDPNGNLGEY